MFIILKKRVSYLLAVMSILVLAFIGGCSALGSPEQTSKVLPTLDFPACDSSEFVLPKGIEAVNKKTARQQGWLSVHLDPMQNIVPHSDSVPFRLTLTNERDYPVIFVWPQYITFWGDDSSYSHPIHLYVDIVSSSGERLEPKSISWDQRSLSLPPQPISSEEVFLVLPPEKSCIMDLQFGWHELYRSLKGSVPPGDYQMRVVFVEPSWGSGTEVGKDSWVWPVSIEPSNVVTITVPPPVQ